MSSILQDLPYWIGCNSIGMGPKTFQKLYKYFKSAQKIWEASAGELRRISDLLPKTMNAIIEKRKNIRPRVEMEKLKKLGINFLTLKDKKYPKILKEIIDPPYVLFYKGNLKILENSSIAVVGTRRMTPYGKRACEKIVYGLAKNKINIVSGLALGIDSVAHKIALDCGGNTVAVLGTSLEFVYPPANYNLAQKIIKNGLIVSEFPLGTRGYPGNFPLRNQIISGLSLGVLVVEAAIKSESLITANYALEQNREVFATPSSIFSPQSTSCNNLIKIGAKPVVTYEDILDELNIDKITEKMKMQVPEISSILTLLEIKGLVKNIGG